MNLFFLHFHVPTLTYGGFLFPMGLTGQTDWSPFRLTVHLTDPEKLDCAELYCNSTRPRLFITSVFPILVLVQLTKLQPDSFLRASSARGRFSPRARLTTLGVVATVADASVCEVAGRCTTRSVGAIAVARARWFAGRNAGAGVRMRLRCSTWPLRRCARRYRCASQFERPERVVRVRCGRRRWRRAPVVYGSPAQ